MNLSGLVLTKTRAIFNHVTKAVAIVAYDAGIIGCKWCGCGSVLWWWGMSGWCLHVRWTMWIEICAWWW